MHGPNFKQGIGKGTGEQGEQFFSYLSKMANITKGMSYAGVVLESD